VPIQPEEMKDKNNDTDVTHKILAGLNLKDSYLSLGFSYLMPSYFKIRIILSGRKFI
jgi:hypothetical protein